MNNLEAAKTCFLNALQEYVSGNFSAAEALLRQSLELAPDRVSTLTNLSAVLLRLGRPHEARRFADRSVELDPNNAEGWLNLGGALHELHRKDAALESYERALALNPNYVEAHSNRGNALLELGRLDEAERCFLTALALRPEHIEAHTGMAALHLHLGRFDKAKETLTQALSIRPDYPNAWAMMVRTRKMTADDKDWLNTAVRLVSWQSPALSHRDRINLQFAIGKYCDDTRQYDQAFAAFREANALKRQLEGGFDRARHRNTVGALIATYTGDFLARPRDGANSSRQPVFIVGMPRSGTSLLEQIIASHPAVFGAGELRFWDQQARTDRSAVLSGAYGPDIIAGLAADYIRILQRLSGTATRVVDKMPGNFLWLGLIHVAFPQARIIHMKRHPVDTCLSIHFQNFNDSHSYGTDLDDLVFYYQEYLRLMEHWRKTLPSDLFLEVSYEALINDPTLWSRRIIDFIGLEWDERCLEFHRTERRVGTASNWQVRQKLYHTSRERWRNYEQHLGPLRELLLAE